MKLLIAVVFFALVLGACEKNSSNTDRVLIRIENTTGENFSNFRLNEMDFGSIASGDTTVYRRLRNVLPYPFANDILVNNQYIYFQDIVPTPYMVNGTYLMKVVSDSVWRYRASFIKE